VYKGDNFKYGLDLNGGTSLVYVADLSKIKSASASSTTVGFINMNESMEGLRGIIEKRVNLFGVGEPNVRTDYSNYTDEHRLLVELPGITNIEEAIKKIGDTPLLEFKLVDIQISESGVTSTKLLETGLSGDLLNKAMLTFHQNTNKPMVSIIFNEKGKDIFANLTKNNINKQIAIYLDGNVISSPVVEEAILDGRAAISGQNFTEGVAKDLVQRLNSGALPVPIRLESSQVIEATLGAVAKQDGFKAGMIGFITIIILMIIWYRLPGFMASLALLSYVVIVLSILKIIPVTISAAGMVGFVISLGVAIDANILIFERIKEEIKSGKVIRKSVEEGYARAWTSIRDSNLASLIVATILFYFGSSIISGFALTFAIGVCISMFSAMFISKYFLMAVVPVSDSKWKRFIFLSGFSK